MENSLTTAGKWTFFYTNMVLDSASMLTFTQSIKTVINRNVNVLISNKWSYKYMVTIYSEKDEGDAELSKQTDFDNVVLFNYSYAALAPYRDRLKYVAANFIDETNLWCAFAEQLSTQFVNESLRYRSNKLSKNLLPYILAVATPASSAYLHNVIRTAEFSALPVFASDRQFSIAAVKRGLQQLHNDHVLMYPSRTDDLNVVFDEIVQEEIRVTHLFKSSLFIYLPFKLRPPIKIKQNKYIDWELYRTRRKRDTCTWTPYFHSTPLIVADDATTIYVSVDYPALTYNCLKTHYGFILI